MTDFKSQVQVDLKGNLAASAKSMAGAVKSLVSNAGRDFGRLRSMSVSASNGIDRLGNRYTGLVSSLGVGIAAKGVIDFDRQLKDIQVQAGLTDDAAATLKQKLLDVANTPSVRLDVSQLVAGISSVVDLTGDIQFATDNILNMGISMRASGAAAPDIAKVVAALKKLDIKTPDQISAALAKLIEQGKQGSMPFKDMATELGPLASKFAALGYKGQGALDFLGAFMQTTQDTTTNAAETGTAINAVIADIQRNGAKLEQNGIKLINPDNTRKSLDLVLSDILTKVSKVKDKVKQDSILQSIFGEESRNAIAQLQADFNKTGQFTMLSDLMGVSADGNQMVQDAIDKTHTMAAAVDTLNSAFTRLANNNLSQPIQDLADAIQGLDSDQLEHIFNIAATGAAAAAGIWAVNKAVRGVAGGIRFAQGLRRGGSAGSRAASALSSAAATPVMVTNWPTGGGFGGSGDLTSNRRSRRSLGGRSRSRLGRLASRAGSLVPRGVTKGLTSLGGKAGRLVRGVGPLGAALGAVDIGSSLIAGDTRGAAGAAGGFGGAIAGGELGAAAGTLLGPIGTVLGGLIGAGLGSYFGEAAINGLYDSIAGNEKPSSNDGQGNAETHAALANLTKALHDNTRVQNQPGRRRGFHAPQSDVGGLVGGAP